VASSPPRKVVVEAGGGWLWLWFEVSKVRRHRRRIGGSMVTRDKLGVIILAPKSPKS
jgi:hypothetical protein